MTKDKNDIEKIVLHSTDLCNLNCKYCSRGTPFNKNRRSYSALDFIPWLNFLIKNGIKFRTISISGGEPFLHPNIFHFIDDLKRTCPDKGIRLVTNFLWANRQLIEQYAPKLSNLDNCVISKYPYTIKKCGGNDQFESLVKLFKQSCPTMHIEIHDQSHFNAWEFHEHKEPVSNNCATEMANCYSLGTDGIVSRCVVACGAQHINEYLPIFKKTREYYFDLKNWNKKNFLRFAHKYPFDLCEHCTFTRYTITEWSREDRIKTGELSPVFKSIDSIG